MFHRCPFPINVGRHRCPLYECTAVRPYWSCASSKAPTPHSHLHRHCHRAHHQPTSPPPHTFLCSPIPPLTLPSILSPTLSSIPPSLLLPIRPTLSLNPPSTLSLIPPSIRSPSSAGPSCVRLVDGIVASGPDLSAGGECTTHLSHPKDIPSPPRHNTCPPPHTFLCCPLDCQYVPSLSLSYQCWTSPLSTVRMHSCPPILVLCKFQSTNTTLPPTPTLATL